MQALPVQKSIRRTVLLVMLVLTAAPLAIVSLLAPLSPRLLSTAVDAGQVASQDVLAPETVTYPSEVLTQQRREAAERAVTAVYTSPDTSVARQQLEQLRTALAYITSVRSDTFPSTQQKLGDLAALENVHLDSETALRLLELSDARWQVVQQETILVLEQVMRSTIRSDRLDDARRSVPSLVSLILPEDQAAIVAELVAAFVTPNSIYNEGLTEAARQEARDSVAPVTRTFKAGETVIQRGQVLTAANIEALQQLGLTRPTRKWQDTASVSSLVLLMTSFLIIYLRRTPSLTHDTSRLFLIAGLFLAFLFTSRLLIPGHAVIPYLFPIAAYGLVVAALFRAELALVSSMPLAILAAYGLPNALDLTFYYIIGSFFGVLMLGRARRVVSFIWAGIAVAVSGAIVVVVYRLPMPTTDWIGLATLVGAALFNGLAAASLTVVLQYFLAQFLGMTTPMQLMELTRPDHPLLQRILREAPGTYQHSLQVANLAEQAAERTGADTLLTRVGALYHDAGKALNPIYFIENQVPGFLNPHDDLDPASSAQTIIQHVTDGLKLGREHRLPRRILSFVAEHHGTMVTRYQYVRAVAAAGGDESQVDMDRFRYPGPRPQTRETAILLLADGCEARVRAEHPKDEEELRSLIKAVIANRVSIGQLDDTNLTLRDLEVIANSFTATMRGIYHPRIQYPTLEAVTGRETTVPAEQALPSPQAHELPVSHSVDSTSPVS